MKIAILYNTSDYLLRFRTELILSLQSSGVEVIAITPRDEATVRFESLGVRWLEWRLDGQSINPFNDFLSILDLRRILADEQPDAIINFTIKPVLYGSLVAGLLGVSRVVSMITGMGAIFLPGGIKRRLLLSFIKILYKFSMKQNHYVFFQNDEDLDYFVSHGLLVRDKAMRINGSGVNLTLFRPQPNKVVPGTFLLISRMIREKGIREFVQAARLLKVRYPEACFILVGPIDHNPGAITREEIASWEREGIVRYDGVQSDIRTVLAEAEVYVLPTYYLEGVPRSILEALAMAKPVITTDWRGCRETVSHGINGFLVPPMEVLALANAMERFLINPTLSIPFGLASRQLAENKFDVVSVNAQVVKALVMPL